MGVKLQRDASLSEQLRGIKLAWGPGIERPTAM
jgi:hypothetical protein